MKVLPDEVSVSEKKALEKEMARAATIPIIIKLDRILFINNLLACTCYI